MSPDRERPPNPLSSAIAEEIAGLVETLRGEMEKAERERDEHARSALPGAVRAGCLAEGRRIGLAFAYDLVRNVPQARPSGQRP